MNYRVSFMKCNMSSDFSSRGCKCTVLIIARCSWREQPGKEPLCRTPPAVCARHDYRLCCFLYTSVTYFNEYSITLMFSRRTIFCNTEGAPPESRTRRESGQARSVWGKLGEAVILLTCQFFLPFHPSDGGSWLAADGGAGELRLVPLADHLLAALDDWAAWWDWPTATVTVRETPAGKHLERDKTHVLTNVQILFSHH